MRLFALAIIPVWILVGSPVWACKLTKVKTANEAQMKVYFTRFESEDKTQGRYKKCRLVKKGGQPFFVTPFRQDANVVVHKKNWPG